VKTGLAVAAWIVVAAMAADAGNFIGFLICIATALTLAAVDRQRFDS